MIPREMKVPDTFENLLCHSRESGNPLAFKVNLDSRLRGNDS
jgi:hypothetical protein